MTSIRVLRALTLHQPWAVLLAHGVKQYETRGVPTRHRDWVAIHAGKSFEGLHWLVHHKSEKRDGLLQVLAKERLMLEARVMGAVIAIGHIVECYAQEPPGLTTREEYLGDFGPGRFAWQFADVKLLDKPLPMRGMQGLFPVDLTAHLDGDRWIVLPNAA